MIEFVLELLDERRYEIRALFFVMLMMVFRQRNLPRFMNIFLLGLWSLCCLKFSGWLVGSFQTLGLVGLLMLAQSRLREAAEQAAADTEHPT